MLKLYKIDLNYFNIFFRGETLDHYVLMWCLIHFNLGTGLFLGDSLLGNVVLYWRHCIRVISCHYSVNQSFLILNLHGL